MNKEPDYPSNLAKKLRINEQNVYYHIRQLKNSGLIEIVREEEKKGALCKYYAPTAKAFGFELSGKKKEIKLGKKSFSPGIINFFNEFIKEGTFDGNIVVGSPSQHGPYLTAARDGHYAVHLGFFLGELCTLENKFVVMLDTEVKSEKKENRNLILIGGPVTNILVSEINKNLKINFEWRKKWFIKGKKRYAKENVCLIAKIKNPFNKNKKIIVVSGLHFEGTKAGIIALTSFYKYFIKKYQHNKDFYAVINGLDKDGDGKIDDVEILETKNY